MSLLLAIETATVPGSIALYDGAELIAERPLGSEGRSLGSEVAQILGAQGVERLKAFAVSIGPGSFTGIRVGLSFVKGFAIARDIAVVPISTLRATAVVARAWEPKLDILAMIDARGGEVYGALYRGEALEEVSAFPEAAYPAGVFPPTSAFVVGSGASLISPWPDHLIRSADPNWAPPARIIGALGLEAISAGRFIDAEALEPRYLSRPNVEKPR